MSAAQRPTVLLTLGRLPPAVDLARSFDACGWRVIVCDPFRQHMARTSRCVHKSLIVPAPADHPESFRQAVLGIVGQWNVSLIVPVSEETMHVAALETQLPDGVALFCATQPQVLELHSKLTFVQRARALGLNAPDTARATTDNARQLLTDHACVVKPEFSCSGRGVTHVAAGSALDDDNGSHCVVQRAIDGEEFSAAVVAHNGVSTGIAVYRALVRHGSVAVAFERVSHRAIENWADDFVTRTKHHGFIAFDFIVDAAGQAFAIECNPRATSGLHFFSGRSVCDAIVAGSPLALRPQTQLQEFWSNWTHWFHSIRKPAERRKTGKALRSCRDITWLRGDPWVFLLATFSTWPIIRKAIRHQTYFANVLALDIEWRAEHRLDE